ARGVVARSVVARGVVARGVVAPSVGAPNTALGVAPSIASSVAASPGGALCSTAPRFAGRAAARGIAVVRVVHVRARLARAGPVRGHERLELLVVEGCDGYLAADEGLDVRQGHHVALTAEADCVAGRAG